jgi:putative copper export protein
LERGEIVRKLLFFGLMLVAGVAMAKQWPEIHRYMKIRSM